MFFKIFLFWTLLTIMEETQCLQIYKFLRFKIIWRSSFEKQFSGHILYKGPDSPKKRRQCQISICPLLTIFPAENIFCNINYTLLYSTSIYLAKLYFNLFSTPAEIVFGYFFQKSFSSSKGGRSTEKQNQLELF